MVRNLLKVSLVMLVCTFALCACSMGTTNDSTKNALKNANKLEFIYTKHFIYTKD